MKIFINGIRYHYEIKGRGRPLLLLHGFSGGGKDWHLFEKEFSQEYSLIIVDLIGHSETWHPADPARYEIEKSAEDLRFLLEKLEVSQAHVLGYSMGGRLALAFALKYPEVASSLILVSSSPGIAGQEERKKRFKEDEALAQLIEKQGMEFFLSYWNELPLFKNNPHLPGYSKEKMHQERRSNSPQGLANSLRGMGTGNQPSYWDHLSQLVLPVLLVTGEEDRKFCQIAEKMAALLPRNRWKTLPFSGHRVYLEQPEIFHQLVRSFLNSQE